MIDLKKEMNTLVKEYNDTIIVRHITNIKCNCWRKESNTPDPECNRCYGVGWIFEEFIQKCKVFLIDSQIVSHMQDYDYGRTYSNTLTIYCPVSTNSRKITMNDFIFTVITTEDGALVRPIVRTRRWQITDVPPMNADLGKQQFIKILAKPLSV